jgi:GMP synthase-like glutamine amidotransferase
MLILVLQHEAGAPAGLLGEWALARGHEVQVADVPELAELPAADRAGAIVSLGAESSVERSREPWVARELAYLRAAHAQGRPLLGICFGAQAIAAALGGTVTRAPGIAIEWSAPDWRAPELIPEGPWLRWHEDVFTLPPGAQELASAGGVPMAFALEASGAVQFHPEADAEIARGWIATSRHTSDEHRAGALAALESALEREREDARRRAFDLFDRIAAHWLQR